MNRKRMASMRPHDYLILVASFASTEFCWILLLFIFSDISFIKQTSLGRLRVAHIASSSCTPTPPRRFCEHGRLIKKHCDCYRVRDSSFLSAEFNRVFPKYFRREIRDRKSSNGLKHSCASGAFRRQLISLRSHIGGANFPNNISFMQFMSINACMDHSRRC